jgi:hypothetical protein
MFAAAGTVDAAVMLPAVKRRPCDPEIVTVDTVKVVKVAVAPVTP